ncbi:MAG: hypothetical protein VB027_03165 [Gordonibacter sp.]|nr:hypothetical protein [Gordonibacter sp.]
MEADTGAGMDAGAGVDTVTDDGPNNGGTIIGDDDDIGMKSPICCI